MADGMGKVKELLGWFTADRKVEAEGRAEQEDHGKPTHEHLDEQTERVRKQYGETPDRSDDPDARH
jgi:uncharacterized protein YjbJ (UPF0337 family)